MATVPYCNVTVATPPARPRSPRGIQTIPPSANLQQIINTVNYNFNQLIKGNYVENRPARQTQIVRIFDPSDRNVWVDVRQITAVQFVNELTGQVINWRR